MSELFEDNDLIKEDQAKQRFRDLIINHMRLTLLEKQELLRLLEWA